MDQFSIRQVEQLTGIKAHTLRIWEKRYRLIIPGRSEGKQRTYSNDDLKTILRVVYLYNSGYKISKIAELDEHDLNRKIEALSGQPVDIESVMPKLMEACIALDAEKMDEIFDDLVAKYDFESVVLRVFYPFLEQVGNAWMTSKIRPNNEHFVSHLISKRIISAIGQFKRKSAWPAQNAVLLFQPEGEYHEIPLLFIEYLLRKRGCRTVYLGSNIALSTLEYYCAHKPVSHLFYHVLTNLGDLDAQDLLDDLVARFPGKKIIASGPSAKMLEKKSENVQVLRSMNAIMDRVAQFESRK